MEIHGVHVGNDFNWSKNSFLVVDSKANFRDLVQTALLGAGARNVKHATSIDKAIETMTRYGQEISCVLCDWEAPPAGGLELLRLVRTRALPKTSPRTPFVILTTRADSNVVKAAMALDVNGFAVAPLSFEKLVKTVQHALQRTWLLRQPSEYASVPRVDIAVPPPSAPPPREMGRPADHHTHSAPSTQAVAPQRLPGGAAGAPQTQPAKRAPELKNVHMCILAEVRPGQVLARDLRDKEGHLLLSAGAVLRPALLDRLMNVAEGHADSYHLWIGDRDEASA